jgi:hypothetical protein
MTAQIGEVLASYWRRTISTPYTALMVLIALIGIIEFMIVPMKQMPLFIWMSMYGPGLVAIHLKQQIVQIRESRLPNALASHICVGLSLLLLVALGLPVAAMASKGVWSWGFPGFVIAISAGTFALVSVEMNGFWILIIPLMFVGSVPKIQQWLDELSHGQHEQIGLGLLAAGICGFTGTIWWLLHLSEESPSYFRRTNRGSNAFGTQHPGTDDEQARAAVWQKQWMAPRAPSDRQVQSWPRMARGSIWERARLWNVGRSGGMPIWYMPAMYFVIFLIAGFMMPGAPNTKATNNVVFMIFFPIFTAVGIAPLQREIMSVESLRPVNRMQFLWEMGLTFAYRLTVSWVAFSISWCALAVALASGKPDWVEIADALVLTAGSQVLLYGIVVWLMRYNFVGARIFVFIAIGLASAILGTILGRGNVPSPIAIVIATPVLVVVGGLIIADAYRRWLQTELG